jgi:hypothetical protein
MVGYLKCLVIFCFVDVFVPQLAFAQAAPAPKAPATTKPATPSGNAPAPADAQFAATPPKSDPADVVKTLAQLKMTLTATKAFLKTLTDTVSNDTIKALKVAALDDMDTALQTAPSISADDQKALKQKRDSLMATINAANAIKAFLADQKMADLVASVDSALAAIAKVDVKSSKISIISAEYGDLKNKTGVISKSLRYCDIKDKAIKACQNQPFCSLPISGICTDPAPQVDTKTMDVKFECLGPDRKAVPDEKGNTTREATGVATATELFVVCTFPDGAISSGSTPQ